MGFLEKLGWREPAAVDPLTRGDAAEIPGAGRRDRDVNDGSFLVQDAIGVKLMHGWLQNRHQTLMPLTFNVGALSTSQRATLARIVAAFLLIGRPAAEAAAFAPSLREWLMGAGGDAETLAVYDRAMAAPLPLNEAFDRAQDEDLTIYAYVAALMASDTRYPVSILLCDLVQARFELPAALVRSAVRRYRR